MAKRCGKCDPHEICEECPEWIFTLADLIMCMMGLFVLLWVLKPPPGKQGASDAAAAAPEAPNAWTIQVGEIRGAFGYTPDPNSLDPVDIQMLARQKPMKGPGMGGETTVPRETPPGTDDESTTVRQGKQATAGGRVLFAAGSPDLSAEARAMLDAMVGEIRGHKNVALVKGHTALDDLPRTASAERKMSLSVSRAQAVQDYLVSRGVEPEILRVQGSSTFEPVVQRTYTPDGQAPNRRVEVEVTATLVNELQDRADTLPPMNEAEVPLPADPAPIPPAPIPIPPATSFPGSSDATRGISSRHHPSATVSPTRTWCQWPGSVRVFPRETPDPAVISIILAESTPFLLQASSAGTSWSAGSHFRHRICIFFGGPNLGRIKCAMKKDSSKSGGAQKVRRLDVAIGEPVSSIRQPLKTQPNVPSLQCNREFISSRLKQFCMR